MIDLRKSHYWTVGLPGDPNAKDVLVSGRRFLAIPYTLVGPQDRHNYLCQNEEVLVSTLVRNCDLQIDASVMDDSSGSLWQDGLFIAKNCKRPTVTDRTRLAKNVSGICAQLGIAEKMRISCDNDRLDELPVLRPAAGSLLHVKTVYLFAARR